jgi:hypothetical protein
MSNTPGRLTKEQIEDAKEYIVTTPLGLDLDRYIEGLAVKLQYTDGRKPGDKVRR